MTVRNKKEFLINIAYAAVMLSITYGLFRFATGYLLPFIFGFLIASLVKPLVSYTKRAFGNRKLLAIGVVVVFYILIALVLFWLALRFIAYVQVMVPVIESFYEKTLSPVFTSLAQSAEQWITQLDPTMANIVDTALTEMNQAVISVAKSLSGVIVTWITGLVTSIPNLFIGLLITIISSFFFTLDYSNIVDTCLNVLSPKTKQLVLDVGQLFSVLIGKYIKSYTIIIFITFTELAIGFSILRIPNAIMLAGIIAIVDILPVLGTGTILIPWGIYSLITGNVSLGVGLVVIYAVITIIRNILEPKVIGDQIGLHPIATLISIFVGLKLFGFWGLFGVPIFVTIVVTLHKEGKIDFFKFFGFRGAGSEEYQEQEIASE
ncbi:hypothetical protein AOC36_03350 [Erysipelothrix larvae]|uniref:Sporulation integral membrane protein YtvI n=1 Tax=Erysipelothrix larvae TaxID=1514105 RepID=A0A109UGQ8_9FIRM|nr:sporulation integral membrane protein YtvI [Erysipelothrix larvae]AMC93047.1 hypothetical protein AOC36_03350 [Erysipelothrix larvae]